ncbi:arylsulfatase [Lignipirellula cremea]|uniref:Arylsulfatase n=1 Tax=Lignipirellula cremea TaxID=2528010 RepID=A0A518DMV7_9BACT|nr:arylsulfatase [Lignipirellula cremea]QDU93177.1 Arylsulfatase [Lignipirellula cremea]
MRQRYFSWTRLVLLVAVVLPGACLALPTQAAEPARRPNVVVFLTDDQGWGDLGLNGNRDLQTPNIDSLARDGAMFERFFVCPVCSPTRAEFLTGRYHPRGGVYSTSSGGERLDAQAETLAERFQQAGYATAAFGKWHNGMQHPYHPNARGFDTYYGFCSGHWGNYYSPLLEENGRLVKGDGFLIDDFTDHAIQFIEEHRDQPFLVYLPYNTPHAPMQVPDKFWNRFADRQLTMLHHEPEKQDVPHTRAALAMCENIDWNVGRVLAKLEELKLADNTIVVYFHDNGPNGWRFNDGMKGRKGATDEGGVRSPLLVRWPGRIASGTKIAPIASVTDLLPTLTDLTGIPGKPAQPLDGVSLKPLLLAAPDQAASTAAAWPDRKIFSHWSGRVSVRTQRFRLDHKGLLYDMQADPGQQHDVTATWPAEQAALAKAAAAWKEELLTGLGEQDWPFPIGYGGAKYTQLPARDAETTGGIERSNRHPNCTYFLNWTSVDDRITWDVEATPGRYAVEVLYACPAADVGSVIELRLGDQAVQTQITEAHDPPLHGEENDRVPRPESYVKDFKPLSLGVLELSSGRGQLTLRALKIPGRQAMEMRLLMLTRLLDDQP